MAATLLRRLIAVLAVLAAAVVFLSAPAMADPDGGSTKTLEDALTSAAKGQAVAQQQLASSQKRQRELQALIVQSKANAAQLQSQVNEIATRSYENGRASTSLLLLDSTGPDNFMERAEGLDLLAQLDGRVLGTYQDDLSRQQQAKAAIDQEVTKQAQQVALLAEKKKEAQLALASIGGGASATGFVDPNSPLAKAAPRNSDGSWPTETCSINDPTTTGCITPRMLNAYQQSRAAGYTHYTACFRHQDSGEHPKGRACDFSAHASGFVDVAATGADKAWGNSLAAYFVKNADRLGVLYVIWYRQIWLPGSGWKTYTATGDAAAVHTNHVHLSVL